MAQTRVQHALLAASVAIVLAPAAAAQANAFGCPATLTVTEQAQTPQGWAGPGVKAEHTFKTAKIYNGNPGKEEYDLKPDDDEQHGKSILMTWVLKDYRDMNLFVRCFYYDTSVTITANIPATVSKCSVTLMEMNASGEIVGKSEMKCQ